MNFFLSFFLSFFLLLQPSLSSPETRFISLSLPRNCSQQLPPGRRRRPSGRRGPPAGRDRGRGRRIRRSARGGRGGRRGRRLVLRRDVRGGPRPLLLLLDFRLNCSPAGRVQQLLPAPGRPGCLRGHGRGREPALPGANAAAVGLRRDGAGGLLRRHRLHGCSHGLGARDLTAAAAADADAAAAEAGCRGLQRVWRRWEWGDDERV